MRISSTKSPTKISSGFIFVNIILSLLGCKSKTQSGCAGGNFVFASGFCRLKSKYNFSRLYKSRASQTLAKETSSKLVLKNIVGTMFVNRFGIILSCIKKLTISLFAFCLISGSFSLAHSPDLSKAENTPIYQNSFN